MQKQFSSQNWSLPVPFIYQCMTSLSAMSEIPPSNTETLSETARREILEGKKAGVHICQCGCTLMKISGCNWVQCANPKCKRGICLLCGTPIEHSGAALQNHECNPEAAIEHAVKVQVAAQANVSESTSDTITITVRTFSGECINVICAPSALVDELQEKIRQKTGIEPTIQVLTCMGKLLQRGTKLIDARIRNKATVAMTASVNGGSEGHSKVNAI
jgi:hypothetical protein